MKIALVYDAVYPWVKGGAEKRIYELGKRLVKHGHDVHIFGIKWWDGPDRLEFDGMTLHGVCAPMELYVGGRRSITEAIIFALRIFPYLVREKFDLIDTCAFPYFSCFSAKLASIIRRTPVVITWHEVWGDYWYVYLGKPGFFGELVEYAVSKLASVHIAVSGMTKNELELLGVNGKNIHLVPNGIDLNGIAIIPPSPDECDIIFVGRLIREKNVDVLLRALAQVRETIPDVKCHIIGGGPEKERLFGLATRRGLLRNVRFFEFMEYDEVIARIKSSKILALLSSREGFGIVVIEAFACGVPVITVKSPWNAAYELVNEKTGMPVNLDAEEIGRAICLLIKDVSLREKMAEASKNEAKMYDWDGIAGKVSCIYEEYLLKAGRT
jgi:glycosyltransferase involved in cell wall biosynthesis